MKNDKDMIKRAGIEDAEALAALAIQMWSDHAPEDLEAEFRRLAMNDEAACFIKYVDEKPIAFAQCGLRHDYVEGTDSSPVGYLEGVFCLGRISETRLCRGAPVRMREMGKGKRLQRICRRLRA